MFSMLDVKSKIASRNITYIFYKHIWAHENILPQSRENDR